MLLHNILSILKDCLMMVTQLNLKDLHDAVNNFLQLDHILIMSGRFYLTFRFFWRFRLDNWDTASWLPLPDVVNFIVELVEVSPLLVHLHP